MYCLQYLTPPWFKMGHSSVGLALFYLTPQLLRKLSTMSSRYSNNILRQVGEDAFLRGTGTPGYP